MSILRGDWNAGAAPAFTGHENHAASPFGACAYFGSLDENLYAVI